MTIYRPEGLLAEAFRQLAGKPLVWWVMKESVDLHVMPVEGNHCLERDCPCGPSFASGERVVVVHQ